MSDHWLRIDRALLDQPLSEGLLLRAERVLENKYIAKVTPKTCREERFEALCRELENAVGGSLSPTLPLFSVLREADAQRWGESVGCVEPIYGIGARDFVPCRKCEGCRLRIVRKLIWQMLREVSAAPRTWHCGLTFAEESEGYREFQLFMKRVRKRTPSCRFYAVSERGSKRGRFHYHALIFCTPSLKKAEVQASWTVGHSFAKLVDMRMPFAYLAKYVTKDCTKLRASNHFGHSSAALLAFEELWE